MIGYFKQKVKSIFLRFKGINIDFKSSLNYNVQLPSHFKSATIKNSSLKLAYLGNGCFIENVMSYGNIILADNVSISGPGTVLHAEKGVIKIGRFSSIAQNVTIQEFNHDMSKPTTFAMNHFFFTHNFKDDVVSKGDVILEEDVWVGSNVVILSGVTIGRGSIIAAGSIVTKDVEPYSIVGGVPAKLIKKRFSDIIIKQLEDIKWWEWGENKILENKQFFNTELK